jgi:hypothetical protein
MQPDSVLNMFQNFQEYLLEQKNNNVPENEFKIDFSKFYEDDENVKTKNFGIYEFVYIELELLLKKSLTKNIFDHLQKRLKFIHSDVQTGMRYDFYHGSYWKTHDYFQKNKDSQPLAIFLDDFKSSGGKICFLCFIILGDVLIFFLSLEKHLRVSKVNVINLGSFKRKNENQKDKLLNFQELLAFVVFLMSPFFNGKEFVLNDGTKIVFKGNVLFILGDNLMINEIVGHSTFFSKEKYINFKCEHSRDEKDWKKYPCTKYRDIEEYRNLGEFAFSTKTTIRGCKIYSSFNNFPGMILSKGVVYPFVHLEFEGGTFQRNIEIFLFQSFSNGKLGRKDFKKKLRNFIKSYPYLRNAFKNLRFLDFTKYLKSKDDTLFLQATEIRLLGLIIIFLLEENIDKNDQLFQLLILDKAIVSCALKDSISNEDINNLDGLLKKSHIVFEKCNSSVDCNYPYHPKRHIRSQYIKELDNIGTFKGILEWNLENHLQFDKGLIGKSKKKASLTLMTRFYRGLQVFF